MADLKISALTASTTPLAGTEVLPIVQSSTTKQVSVANLTAGRSFDALGMTLTSTDAGAAAAPLLELYRDSASPAASDTLGEIEFNGEDSAGNKQAYGLIHASILSPTSTTEQGQIHFETATAGALTEKMIIGTTNLVINEIGAVFNVRIEGDTDANLFYTDATNSRVGVGTITPAEKLEVNGNILTSIATGNPSMTVKTAGSGNNPVYRLQFGSDYWDIQGTGSNVGKELYLIYSGAALGYFNSSTGVYVPVSDRNLKKNIVDISHGLSAIMALRPVEYNMKTEADSVQKHLGFIAQEAQEVLPSSVSEMLNDTLGMDKTEIIAVLVKAVQELKVEIDSLKNS
jgi:hypothetical protein